MARETGIENVEELLSGKIEILEKLDSSTFAFSVNKGGHITFYKRDPRNPITIVDRTLMGMYEDSISKVISSRDSLSPDTKYFAEIVSGVGTFMTRTEPSMDTVEISQLSSRIGMLPPPLKHFGTLNRDVIEWTLEAIQIPLEELDSRLNGNTLPNEFLRRIDRDLSCESFSEGIVLKFEDGSCAKLVGIHHEDKDFQLSPYQLALNSVFNFMDSQDLTKHKPQGRNSDEKYLDLCCHFFNEYVREGNRMEIDRPKFMVGKKEFDLNTKFIKNRETLEIVREFHRAEEFKVFLNGLRKKRYTDQGIFRNQSRDRMNALVDRIQRYIRSTDKKGILPFSEYKKFSK